MTNHPARTVWVRWALFREDGVTLRKPGLAHLAVEGVDTGHLGNGNFPLECGRWAPEGFDAELEEDHSGRYCRRCLKAAAARRPAR